MGRWEEYQKTLAAREIKEAFSDIGTVGILRRHILPQSVPDLVLDAEARYEDTMEKVNAYGRLGRADPYGHRRH